jgi:DNA-binding CsgD family transcriptional regulator/predicted negative regulator of RcsB-dependent stress response
LVEDFELLERERELGVLSALIAAVCRGAGQLAVVEGTAGIGKTRLLAAARAVAERDGLRVLGARASELEREFAYGVVRQLFEPALTGADPAGRAELLAGAAGQAAMLFGHVDAAALSMGGDVSFAALHGLYWLTANLCARKPLMLVVDDLHWADVPSLRFLAYLLSRLEGLPLVVVVGLRPAELVADQHLLTQITTDPLVTVVRPAPLSQAASTRLVRTVLTEDAEKEFCLACHTASGGNPLLLHELVGMALAEGLEATAAGVARLAEIGPRALRQRVALRLARLGPSAAALCAAVAILGDGADPRYVTTLAGLEPAQALQTARQLADIGILYHRAPSPDEAARLFGMLGFVHPLVRAAVYEGLSETERLTGHARAARLLSEGGKAAEQVAAHLLRVPPAADSFVVTTLQRAANDALARGSPESAVSALERCLQELPPDTDRADIFLQLGTAAQLVDMVKGADYLAAAMTATNDPERKATIAEMLGIVLTEVGRCDEAVQILSQAARILGQHDIDLNLRLEGVTFQVGLVDPAVYPLAAHRVNQLRDATPNTGLGTRILDINIALYDAFAGQPREPVVERTRRALANGSITDNSFASCGYFILIAADQNEVMALLDAEVAEAYRRDSLLVLSPAKWLQGLAWLAKGALAEAETNLRDALWSAETASLNISKTVIVAHLADVLMEQGNIDEAETIFTRATTSKPMTRPGYWYCLLESRARLRILQGQMKKGLETMLACGHRFAAHGGQNPAIIAWRSGAALALFSLGRPEEARALAAEELTLARRWGAPRALGRALRIAGLVQGGEEGLALLHQAVEVLAPSPARLEHAKALVELGAALRRSGQRLQSRQYLRRGVELAQICGATPLVKRGFTELRASGARPRHITPSGPDALTPSERRVAGLAASGQSNRDIAQTLFITTNTVEVHLTRTYRKLGITGRADLTPHFKS